jgi:YggT family protein
MTLLLAVTRVDVAGYVSSLFNVYSLILLAYIVVNLVLSFGGRIPYSRTTNAILGFLRDVSEPYLRIFRRLLPSFGGFDFSPIIAFFVLRIVQSLVVSAIQG